MSCTRGPSISPGDQCKAFQTHRTKAALLPGMMRSTCRAQARGLHSRPTQGAKQRGGLWRRWGAWDASQVLTQLQMSAQLAHCIEYQYTHKSNLILVFDLSHVRSVTL